MAQKDIIFNMKINGVDREIKTMGDLKKATKDVKSELLSMEAGTKEFADASKRLNELQEKMGDVGDAAKITGNATERLQASFGMFAEGVKTFDGGKMSVALQGIGQAMKAIPLILVIQGIQYLVENFDRLSKGSGLLGKSLRAIGDLFTWIGDKITEFTDMIGVTNSALDKQGEAIKTNADKAKEALNSQTAAYDRQMEVAKAAGKSTIELEKAKQKAIIDTNYVIAKQIEAFVRAGGELDEEKKKQLTASLEAIKAAKTQMTVIEITAEKEKEEKLKEQREKSIKAKEEENKRLIDLDKQLSDAKIAGAQVDKENRKMIAEDVKTQAQKEADEEYERLVKESNRGIEVVTTAEQEAAIKRLAIKREFEANSQALQNATLNSAKAVSDAIFAYQLANVQKGSQAELEIRKKQFNVDKALNITKAVIDGIAGVQSQLKAGPFVGPILAGLVAVTAAANVAKIASMKFDAGSAGANMSASSGGGGSFNLPTPPTTAPSTQPSTRFDEQGNNLNNPGTVKAYVVETEISGSQGRVNRLQDQATFG